MPCDIFAKIQSCMNGKLLTNAEKKAARFVLQKPTDVLYLSITDLAKQCGVGDTSVFRFCKTLGFKGYQDFKMTLAQSLSSRGGANSGAMTLSDEIGVGDSTDQVCRKLLSADISALNQTFDMLDKEKIGRAVEILENGRMIYFFGSGSSGVMALEAKNKFARILTNVVAPLDSHMQAMAAALLGKEDVAVAFSYSGSTRDVIETMKYARENHAKTICVTRFSGSPLTAYADVSLLYGGANEGPFQGGLLSAKIAQLYLLDVLYTEFFKKNYNICDYNKKRTSQAIASKML